MNPNSQPDTSDKIEQLFLDRIKSIGDNEFTLLGYPAELLKAITAHINQVVINELEAYASAHTIQALEQTETELREAVVALGFMYSQYCGPNFGHDFMGAGESAIEVLEKYGLGNERDGVDEIALDKLERGSALKRTQDRPDTRTRC